MFLFAFPALMLVLLFAFPVALTPVAHAADCSSLCDSSSLNVLVLMFFFVSRLGTNEWPFMATVWLL